MEFTFRGIKKKQRNFLKGYAAGLVTTILACLGYTALEAPKIEILISKSEKENDSTCLDKNRIIPTNRSSELCRLIREFDKWDEEFKGYVEFGAYELCPISGKQIRKAFTKGPDTFFSCKDLGKAGAILFGIDGKAYVVIESCFKWIYGSAFNEVTIQKKEAEESIIDLFLPDPHFIRHVIADGLLYEYKERGRRPFYFQKQTGEPIRIKEGTRVRYIPPHIQNLNGIKNFDYVTRISRKGHSQDTPGKIELNDKAFGAQLNDVFDAERLNLVLVQAKGTMRNVYSYIKLKRGEDGDYYVDQLGRTPTRYLRFPLKTQRDEGGIQVVTERIHASIQSSEE